MNWYYILASVATILSFVLTPFLSIWRQTMERIKVLEQKMETRITEEVMRTHIEDKLEPVRIDLKEVADKLDKIYDYLIKK